MNHSKEVWKFGNKLDHLGIVLVIWVSTFCSDSFGFYCDDILRAFYCFLVMSYLSAKHLIFDISRLHSAPWVAASSLCSPVSAPHPSASCDPPLLLPSVSQRSSLPSTASLSMVGRDRTNKGLSLISSVWDY